MPIMSMRLRPIRSPTTPKVNSSPANTSVYELIAHSSCPWLAPRPAGAGSAMVLSATFRTVLSRTIAIRLVISTPRISHRRRYTLSWSEAAVWGETLGEAIDPFTITKSAGPVYPGAARRPGRANNTEQTRIAKHSPHPPGIPGAAPPAGARPGVGYLLFPPDDILITSGDATKAPRGERIPMNASLPSPGEAATKARTAEPLYGATTNRRVTVRDIAAAKARGEKWPMLTAYDALTARVFDDAGIPVLLVGDSA